jgi:hypothetical protein
MLSYLARLQNQTESEPPKAPKVSSGGFGGSPPARFQNSELADGLLRLQGMRPPRLATPDVWPGVVADAVWLGSEGRGGSAMALGWSLLDLFGCSPDIGGDAGKDGLAVWLNGRRDLLIGAECCILRDGQQRALFNRRPRPGGVLLWELTA